MRLFLRLSAGALLLASLSWEAGSAVAGVLITVDKANQRMTVAVEGRTRYLWPVSTGRGGYATPSGSFKPFRLERDHYSKEWDDAPMPHSIFFTKTGHAIHGSFDVRRLGTPASHGCVRLAPANAARLFALVQAEGLGNVRVVLDGETPGVSRRAVQSRQLRAPAQRLRRPPADAYEDFDRDPDDGFYGRNGPLRLRQDYGLDPIGWR